MQPINSTPFISLVNDLSGDLTDVITLSDHSIRRNQASVKLIPGNGTGGSYFLTITSTSPVSLINSTTVSTRCIVAEPVAVLKPSDEEAFAINNPKGFGPILDTDVGKDGRRMKHGILPGEGASREAAAYLLDFNHFARVPRTALVIARHEAFHTSHEFKVAAAIAAATTTTATTAAAAGLSTSSSEESRGGGRGRGKNFAIPISSHDALSSSSSSSNFSPMLYPLYVGTSARSNRSSPRSSSSSSSILSTSSAMPFLALSTNEEDDTLFSSASTPRPTLTVSDAISMPVKECSLQAFVPHACSAEDVGTSFWPVEDVQAIAMLDIRCCNADRNDDNLLIRVWRNNIEIKTLEGAEDALRFMKQQQQQQTSLVRQSSFSDRNEQGNLQLQRSSSLTKSSSSGGLSLSQSQSFATMGLGSSGSSLVPSGLELSTSRLVPSLQRVSSINERLGGLSIKINNTTGVNESSTLIGTKSSTPRSLRDDLETTTTTTTATTSGNKTPRPDLFSTLAQQQLLLPSAVVSSVKTNLGIESNSSNGSQAGVSTTTTTATGASLQQSLMAQTQPVVQSLSSNRPPSLLIPTTGTTTGGLARQASFSMLMTSTDTPTSSSSFNSFLNNSLSPSSQTMSLPTPTVASLTSTNVRPSTVQPESRPWRSSRLDKLKLAAKSGVNDIISADPISLSPKYEDVKMSNTPTVSSAVSMVTTSLITSPLIRSNSYRSLSQEVRLEIIPVDHGAILPSSNSLDDLQLSWVHWPQVKKPVSPKIATYIKSLDGRADALKIHRAFGSKIRPSCLLTLRLCTMLLKLGVEKGLTLSEIGRMMLRESGLGRIDPEGNKQHSTSVSLSPSNVVSNNSKSRSKLHLLHRYQRSLAVEASTNESNTRESRRQPIQQISPLHKDEQQDLKSGMSYIRNHVRKKK
jgi:hypothetical protein